MELRTILSKPAGKALTAVLGGIVLCILVLAIGLTSFAVIYRGRIFPGLSVAGVDLSGQTPTGAAEKLAEAFAYPEEGTITLQYDSLSWEATPAELGLYFSPNYNAEIAFQTGRSGGIFSRFAAQVQLVRHGINRAPRFVMDERTGTEYLKQIAAEINQPVREASLELDGLDVVVESGQIGQELDIQASLEVIALQMRRMTDGSLPLMVEETYPEILDVSAQADAAREILSQPLTLTIPGSKESDPGPWELSRETLVEMMVIERVSTPEGETYRIALDAENLRGFLDKKAKKINRDPQNARMYFDDETRELVLIEEEQVGFELGVNESIIRIEEDLAQGIHKVDLVVDTVYPEITSETTAEELGITELVIAESTYFYGSDPARVNNIRTASSQFHGIFVAPGETFSMADQLGDVSLDTGYSEAWIIFGDRTIKGVGGGVCQVSTTLFRTVFFGGLPVVERYPHSYRVGYYEQTASGAKNSKLAGLDATVYVPLVDFKFTNDTGNWILMETYMYNNVMLTWKFYGTSDGRTVDWSTTGVKNKKDPPDPIYEENPELAKGEVRQVDWAAEGGTVTVTRNVYRDGDRLWQDVFKTKYQPWAAVCQYGPGTGKMPPKNPDPDNPCKKK